MNITRETIKSTLRTIMAEETEYQTFFKKALEKAGKSIPSMSDEEKKEFFNKIDAAWNAKGEKNEELVGNQHKLDVDGDGEIEASDLAALRAKKDESVTEGKKVFSVNPGIGKVKYSISSHDGVKKHKDGSDFFDIETFKNKVDLEKAIKNYTSKGFQMESVVTEGVSSKDMDKIKSAVESASSFMGIGSELKKTGLRYIFATSPMPVYIVQPTPNNKVAIVNKKYASKPDFVIGDTAVGVMESINLVREEKYPIAVEKFNKELIKHPMVKKAAQFYKKTPAEIVKAVQQRLYTKGDRSGNTKEVYIDFNDTTSGITIKHKMKFNESAGCSCGCGGCSESVNEASKPTIKVVSKLKNEEGIQIVVTKTTDGDTMYGGFVVRGKLQKVIPVGANSSKEGVKKRALQIWDEFGKQLGESVNEAASDRDFEKVYSIFDKKDYFGLKGSIKTMLGNWQRALDKGDKGAQQYSKEDVINSVTAQTKARAKYTYDELVKAIKNKDINALKSKLRHDQQFSIAIFTQTTGKKLPKSTRDIHSFLDNEFMGESITEGRAFINAAKKAKAEGKTEFEFNGKTYPVTIKESVVNEVTLRKGTKIRMYLNGNSDIIDYVLEKPNYYNAVKGGKTNLFRVINSTTPKVKVGSTQDFSTNDLKSKIKFNIASVLVSDSVNEGRAFINAAKKAKAEGKTEFEFNGKTYPVTIKESVVNEDANMNKKVKAFLDKGLKDLSKGKPNHHFAVMHILMGALTDANFHSEAKKVPSIFSRAKYEGDPMGKKDVISIYEEMGENVASICKWDGKDIVDAIGFYVSMTIGRPVGEKVEKLVESVNETIYLLNNKR
jgi:hypothetical protein